MCLLKCATVGRLGQKCAKGYPVYTGKIYAAKQRKDGKLQWVLDSYFGRSASAGYAPSKKLTEELICEAAKMGLPWKKGIKQWMEVKND